MKIPIHKTKIRIIIPRLVILGVSLILSFGLIHISQAQTGPGEKTITLSLTDTPINQLLSIIGDTFGVGVVASKGATGNVNVSLNNSTLEQALDSITQPNGWVWVRKDNTITIFTKQEYDEYMKQNVIPKWFYILNTNAQEIQNSIQPLITTAGKIIRDDRTNAIQVTDTPESIARIEQVIQTLDVPIDVEVISLKYATASEVKTQIDKIKTPKGDIQLDERTNTLIITDVPSAVDKIKKVIESLDVETQMEVFEIKYAKPEDVEKAIKELITKKGYIQTDKRFSRIIVDDIPSHLEKIKRVIEAIDQPDRLVYIEGEIVDMDYQTSLDLGIDWSYGANFSLSNSSTGGVLLTIPNNNFQSTIKNYFSNLTSQVGFNLSASAKAMSKLGANSEILASPRIMVKSDEEATFTVGGTQPYSVLYTQPLTGTTGTSYQQYYSQMSQDYGISLKISKCRINADGVIEMKVILINSNADPVTLNSGTSNSFTGVKTTKAEANTTIQVHNNETVVIGGLVSKGKTESGSGIPFLENIPLVGPILFGSRSKGTSKRNLLLFITPHITTGKQTEAEKLYPEYYKAYSSATSDEELKSKKDLKKKDIKIKVDVKPAPPENIGIDSTIPPAPQLPVVPLNQETPKVPQPISTDSAVPFFPPTNPPANRSLPIPPGLMTPTPGNPFIPPGVPNSPEVKPGN